MSEAPLAGVRVLDMTRLLPGNFATVMLVEMGAEVIKIEAPEGDGTRWVAPHASSGESGAFVQLNRGKSSQVIDLKTDQDARASHRWSAGPMCCSTPSAPESSTGSVSPPPTCSACGRIWST